MACVLGTLAASAAQAQDPAATLRTQYAALQEQLEHSPLPDRLDVESVEGPGTLEGNVYAVVDFQIGNVSDALTSPADWCDTLILHLNVKYCHPVARGDRTVLAVAIGRKEEQPLASAYRVDFVYSVAAARGDYLEVTLNASKGPLGTRNYRFDLEAVSLEAGRTFATERYPRQLHEIGRDTYLAMKRSEYLRQQTVQ